MEIFTYIMYIYRLDLFLNPGDIISYLPTSRWPEENPLQSTTAEECAKVLLCFWIPTFGVPSVITSDRGAQFTSSIWINLCRFLEIIHSPTTSSHPQSSILVERFHRCLKVSPRVRLSGTDWFHHLPLVLLRILLSLPPKLFFVLLWFCQ